jgi:hypothetical protein
MGGFLITKKKPHTHTFVYATPLKFPFPPTHITRKEKKRSRRNYFPVAVGDTGPAAVVVAVVLEGVDRPRTSVIGSVSKEVSVSNFGAPRGFTPSTCILLLLLWLALCNSSSESEISSLESLKFSSSCPVRSVSNSEPSPRCMILPGFFFRWKRPRMSSPFFQDVHPSSSSSS